jgi:hypothetical protein
MNIAATTWLAFGRILEVLNTYANLLLVVITATYVWLTWRNLKALQRASLRERALRHLDDIKRDVVQPVLKWLESEATRKLKGLPQPQLILVKTAAIPRTKPALGEPDYDWRRQLDHALEDPRVISGELFSHVKQIHFPKQLYEFEAFVGTLRQAASDSAAFARECADRIASSTGLQRAAATDNVGEAADSDTLVEVCFRDMVAGRPRPQIGMQVPAAGALQVHDIYSGRPLGRGLTAPTKAWVEGGVALFEDQWAKSGLPQRIRSLLETAASVHRTFEGLEFTYALPGDCEYIGGRGPGLFQRVWLRLGFPRTDRSRLK